MPTTREIEGARIQDQLAKVALPDSRFQYDLNCFIPSFDGNHEATQRAIETPLFAAANLVLVTPDNALRNLRAALIQQGKSFLVPTYGLVRGFLLIEPNDEMSRVADLAASLDGIEHFGRPVDLKTISTLGECDFVAAGTSALSADGIRFGMGYHYLDAEMVILDALGFTSQVTPVVTLLHECQVSADPIMTTPGHVRVGTAFTPASVLHIDRSTGLRDPGEPVIPYPLCDAKIFVELDEFLSDSAGS